jgi:hypothetical protein
MFGFFKKNKPRTLLDEVNDTVVRVYKPLLEQNKKIPDEKLLEIVQTVMRAFAEASESKGERIPGESMTKIASKFVVVYDTMGEDLFYEHLKYEVNLYLQSGLREDYG